MFEEQQKASNLLLGLREKFRLFQRQLPVSKQMANVGAVLVCYHTFTEECYHSHFQKEQQTFKVHELQLLKHSFNLSEILFYL